MQPGSTRSVRLRGRVGIRVSATVMWQEPSLASSSLKRELLIRASVPTRMLPLCEGERKPKI